MDAFDILRKLQKEGHQAFLVGGCVINHLIGRLAKYEDYDISTSASPGEIQQIFKDQKLVEAGTFFRVWYVNDIEVASFRKDSHYGTSAKEVDVTVGTIDDDAGRRDLTINAIYWNPLDGSEPFSPVNGIDDLLGHNHPVIRLCKNPNDLDDRPYFRFTSDPNRVIRALRIAVKVDGVFDPETEQALFQCAHLVGTHVTFDRIKEEILKVLKYDDPRRFFIEAKRFNILRHILPSLDACWYQDGGPYHAETVGIHSIDACVYVPKPFPLLRLAALLHDVGKNPAASTEERDDGNWSFHRHERYSVDLVTHDLSRLRFSRKQIKYVVGLIQTHMHSLNPKSTPRVFRRFLTSCRENGVHWKCWLYLRIADKNSNHNRDWENDDSKEYWKGIIKGIIDVQTSQYNVTGVKSLAVNGQDVMEILNIPPGRKIRDILNQLLVEVQDEKITNEKEVLRYRIHDIG